MKNIQSSLLAAVGVISLALNIGFYHFYDDKNFWVSNFFATVFWFCMQWLFLRKGKRKAVRLIPFFTAATVFTLFIVVSYAIGIYAGGIGLEIFAITPFILLASWMIKTWAPAWGIMFFTLDAAIGFALSFIVYCIQEKKKSK